MVDPFGKIRWYSNGFSETKKYGLQKFKNGNIGFGVPMNGQGKIYEYSMTGQVEKIYDVYPEFENIHHDVFEMPNGNLLATVNKVGIETIEDHIIEIDRNSGSILNIWDLREILQTDRFTFRKIKDGKDWFHTNAVIYDDRDNSIIVSGQAQGLAKVTWDNKLKWILSPHDGWDSRFKNHLLNPISSQFDWSFGQHAPLILPNGNLMLFDNGFGRNFSNELKYSRVVEYKIDEFDFGGDISQEWSYGKERGLEIYSPIISDVDFLEESSTVFITAGSIGFNLKEYSPEKIEKEWMKNVIETRIIEVDKNRNVLFEMIFESSGPGSTYRSEKIILE
jgi:arylsulfate sulfotransferase